MVVHELAEFNVGYFLGELMAMAIFPVTGLILFIVGIRQHSRARQLPPADPQPTPNPTDPLSLPGDSPSPSQYDPSSYIQPRPSRWSVALIAVGGLLVIFGLLGIADGAADLVRQSRGTVSSPQTPNVGQCIAASNFREHTRNPKARDCSEPDAIFEVVTKGDPLHALSGGSLLGDLLVFPSKGKGRVRRIPPHRPRVCSRQTPALC